MNKYTINADGRVVALRDFGGNVKKGDVGGIVDGEHNLSHYGDCWVFCDARVSENARVSQNAMVSDYARVSGNARVYDRARVSGHARVYDYAWVSGNEVLT